MQANVKSEWMCTMYFKYIVVLYSFNLMMTGVASVSFGFFMQGHFDVNLAFHPLQYVCGTYLVLT